MSIGQQQRRGTAALWASTNPVPLAGQICWETDTNLIKVGDGTTAYNSLPYNSGAATVAATANKAVLRDGSANINAAGITGTSATLTDGVLTRFIPAIRTVGTGLTTDTLLSSDNGGIVIYRNTAGLALTLPNNLVTGFNVTIYQRGATVTWSAQAGGNVLSAQGFNKTAANGAPMNFFVESNSGTNAFYIASGYGA